MSKESFYLARFLKAGHLFPTDFLHVFEPEQTLTGLSSVDFLEVPTWATKISLLINGLDPPTSSVISVQIGDVDGIETTGYIAVRRHGEGDTTDGFPIASSSDSFDGAVFYGVLDINKYSDTTWLATGHIIAPVVTGSVLNTPTGIKTLSGKLDRVRLLVNPGPFAAGTAKIKYE